MSSSKASQEILRKYVRFSDSWKGSVTGNGASIPPSLTSQGSCKAINQLKFTGLSYDRGSCVWSGTGTAQNSVPSTHLQQHSPHHLQGRLQYAAKVTD